MFQPGFVEQDNKEVVLKDFDPDTLALLLDYMYTATITITEETVQDILIGANLLLLYGPTDCLCFKNTTIITFF